jgi:oligopeptide/dipeptide ABC transporter ATP-binding protein
VEVSENLMLENNSAKPVLSINDLRTYFHTQDGIARAVDGVSYEVYPGETLGVVGESGCGKSVSAASILRLIPIPPGKIVSGEILFEGQNLLDLPMSHMLKIRGNRISMIFQEPMTSLNPVFTIGYQLSKVFTLHQKLSGREAKKKSCDILAACEIPSPDRILKSYPHELSGGMRQRAMIAMALGCNPAVLIADEPTTALDVTIQAQIMDLILRLKEKFEMAMILITHDLGVIAKAAQRVVVMYAGEKVEETDVLTLFETPAHPYTIALMQSLPVLGRKERFLAEIKGVVPPPYRKIAGCKFADRCPEMTTKCQNVRPHLKEIQKGHVVACIRR